MKKVLKVTGLIVGAIILLLGIITTYISVRGIPTYEAQKIAYHAVSTPQSIARGKKLTLILCAYCHMNHGTGKLTGSRMREAPEEFGVINSRNITQDKQYGIGDWTDGELLFLLRTGIARDGQYIPPYMAKLPHMADDDINAIISFLRSDDPLVSADATPNVPSEVSLLTKTLTNTVWKPMEMPAHKIELPDSSDRVALGRYLAQNLECFSCHSADFKTNDFTNPEKSEGYFGGGNKTLNAEGKVIMTSNITPDKQTGIGNWNEQQFVHAVRFGVKEGEPSLRYPMVPYVLLTEYEVGCIYTYLNTLPPISNDVDRGLD